VLIPLEGVALLMLIPLLNVTGIISEGEKSGITLAVEKIFLFLGLPKSIEIVLMFFVILLGIEALVKFYNSILSADVLNKFTRAMRDRLFSALTYSSWLYLSGVKHAKISQVITNEVQQVKSSTAIFFQSISLIIIVIVHIGMAFYASVIITSVTLFTAGLMLLFASPINKLVKKSSVHRLGQREQLFTLIKNHLDGIKLSKSFGTEAKHVKSFEKHSSEMEDEFYRFTKLYSFNTFAMSIGSGIIICLLIYFSTTVLETSPAVLVLLIFIFFRTVPKITTLQRNVLFMIDMMPSYKSIIDLENESKKNTENISSDDDSKIEFNKAVEFSNVSFSYTNSDKEFLLKNINFTINVNETTAIIGSSGAGKSTILDLLMGLMLPNSGNIYVDNTPIQSGNIKAWRREIGYVPQEPYLLNDTIRNNVLLGKLDATEEEIIDALKLSSAYEFISNMEEGIETVISERGQRLSGGERQRIALARALVHKPSVLILDEATNAIDSGNETKIFDAVENLHRKLTVIIISHRDSTVNRADRILKLENGEIQELKTENI
jgi:ATP-binding cassette subfamily C protein